MGILKLWYMQGDYSIIKLSIMIHQKELILEKIQIGNLKFSWVLLIIKTNKYINSYFM